MQLSEVFRTIDTRRLDKARVALNVAESIPITVTMVTESGRTLFALMVPTEDYARAATSLRSIGLA